MSKIQIINHNTIRIQYDDRVRNISCNDNYIKKVDLVKSLTPYPQGSILIHIRKKTNYPITINYEHDIVSAEKDFKILENFITPDLPF